MALWDTGTRQPVAIKHARKPHKYLSSFCCRVNTGYISGYSSGVRVSAARRRLSGRARRGRAVGWQWAACPGSAMRCAAGLTPLARSGRPVRLRVVPCLVRAVSREACAPAAAHSEFAR